MKMICHFKTPLYYNRALGRFENLAKNWMDNPPRCPPASYMMSDGFGVFLTYIPNYSYTRDRNVWAHRPFYLVKQPQEKWACDFRDDALPLFFQLQVAEIIF